MATGSSKQERDRLPHDEASGHGQTKPYRVNELAERIRQALKVEKRVSPASGFTHEG